MTMMRESCLVTITKGITPEGVERLCTVLIDKLWPTNAGGVHLFYRKTALAVLAPLCYEVHKRQQDLTVRAIRNGLKITIEPA